MASLPYSLNWQYSLQEMEKATFVKRENFAFVWTISNFGEFMERKYEFLSPLFTQNLSTGIFKWKMMIFPKNVYPEGTHIVLRLQKESEDDRSYSVIYAISLIDINGQDHRFNTREKVFQHYHDSDECCVASNRIIRENNLLQNEALVISCKIDLLVCENSDDTVCKSSETPDDIPLYASTSQENFSNLTENFSNHQSMNDLSCMKSDISCTKSKKAFYSENNINALLETDNNSHQTFPENTENLTNDSTSNKTKASLEILSDDLKSLYYTKFQQDITLHAADGELHAHRVILSSRSHYFKKVLSLCGNEINLPAINVTTLDAVLYYLYTGKLQQLTDYTALNLIKACDLMNLPFLAKMTEDFLNSQQLSVSSAIDIFRLSKQMKMDSLKNSALKFMAENYEEVSSTPQWSEMIRNEPHTVGEILLSMSSFKNRSNNNAYS